MTYIQPLLFVCIAVALAGVLRVRPGRGKYIALAGVLGACVISWPPLDWVLSRPLEGQYAVRPFRGPADLQAIVVLGGAVRPPQYEAPYPLPDRDLFTRCEHAAWIYRERPLPVLACEGRQQGVQNGGDTMRELLRRAGVAENMIWTEAQSRSTHENAVYGASVLRAHGVKRIALVVDGPSMPRAAACFRKEGIEVTPAPSELRYWGHLRDELLPSWRAIYRNEITLHEMAGLAWYRVRGWI
jgi:uncharacterized SAM-binding protein YcdF (DUF218 family)